MLNKIKNFFISFFSKLFFYHMGYFDCRYSGVSGGSRGR